MKLIKTLQTVLGLFLFVFDAATSSSSVDRVYEAQRTVVNESTIPCGNSISSEMNQIITAFRDRTEPYLQVDVARLLKDLQAKCGECNKSTLQYHIYIVDLYKMFRKNLETRTI